jgi:HK97 family phage portal protein
MAWNTQQTKRLDSGETKAARIGPGAPVAMHPATAGKPYRDSWDIERAYREGLQKVVWVSRCIDAIAGNQARLPIMLRKNNDPEGEVLHRRHKVLKLLNNRPNEAENAFAFRYRLSSQLLMSTRGVFIEKVYGRNGEVQSINLLPPEFTSPLPDPKKFVSGFEVALPSGHRFVLPPENVLWIRRPHPLDPYLSITPMESAGIAIEIENLSRLYNRNFLLNDGRPGGLLVVRGEIDDDDKDELRSRFRGNIGRTGQVSVISSDDGADYIDTASNPRDAAYIEMRQITKEEILASFGVPESVIGNASGRTFANAAEELRVFWNETMMPHLEVLARSLDELDDSYYIDFNTKDVPILILSKQERERYVMEEFRAGLISANEYRENTGRKTVESEIADQLLANPNLVPIANTEKPFSIEEQMPIAQAGEVPGGPEGGMPADGQMPGMAAPPADGAPSEGATVTADQLGSAPAGAPQGVESAVMPIPEGQLQERLNLIQTKILTQALSDWEVKADTASERWTEILDQTLDRFFERQQRVILEKSLGAKGRKSVRDGSLTADSVCDVEVWNKQIEEDFRPLFATVLNDAADSVDSQSSDLLAGSQDEIKVYLDAQMQRMKKVNATTCEEIAAAILIVLALSGDEDEKMSMLRAALLAIFANLIGKRKRIIAEHEGQTAFNAGVYFGSKAAGVPRKRWVTRKDAQVRSEHAFLEGKSVPVQDGFAVDGTVLRFPGDPLAPPHLTINCRCKLRYQV